MQNFRLSVCLSVWLYVCMSILAVDTITFEGVNGSKQNLVGQISLNSGGNAKRLARNVFEAHFNRWFKKRVSADAL